MLNLKFLTLNLTIMLSLFNVFLQGFVCSADGDPMIQFFQHNLPRLSMHDVQVTISGPKLHDFALVNIGGHLPPLRPLDGILGLLEGLFTYFGVISKYF